MAIRAPDGANKASECTFCFFLFVLVFVNVCDGTRCQRSSEDLGLAIEGGETNCGRKCSLAFCVGPTPACQLVEVDASSWCVSGRMH